MHAINNATTEKSLKAAEQKGRRINSNVYVISPKKSGVKEENI